MAICGSQNERFDGTAASGGVQPFLPAFVSDLGKRGMCHVSFSELVRWLLVYLHVAFVVLVLRAV